MGKPTIEDTIAALARNTRFTDDGDRTTVLAFTDRDHLEQHDTDPFAPRLSNEDDNAGGDDEDGQDNGDVLFDPSQHSVPDVRAHIERNPADRDRVLDAERAGKNRPGVFRV